MEAAEHAGAIAIIIPSYDNLAYLEPCLKSILMYTTGVRYHIYVVNNGALWTVKPFSDPRMTILEAGSNLGWEGGLQVGLEYSSEEYVVFLNDDTLLPPSSARWLAHMSRHLCDPRIGAVGPASNCVAGAQAIGFLHPEPVFAVRYLIGFCLLIRRSTLAAVGGIDVTLPGGDDIDLSIRLRQAGYTLLADRGVFVYHHGFVTGTRVYGNHLQPGGWNSPEMTQRTMAALAAKHGRAIVDTLWA